MGMAFLLANWATGRRVTRIAGRLNDRRLISNIFDIILPTGCSATAVARRRVGVVVSRLVGMALKGVWKGVITFSRCDSPQGGANIGRKVCQLMERCGAHGRCVQELGGYDSCQEL